jgi:RimJ/RimL family protein N-acetyltransferase
VKVKLAKTTDFMPDFPRSIAAYWERVFTCGEVIQAGQDLQVTINPTLDHQRSVMILQQADGSIRAALTPQVARLLSLQAGAQPLSLQQFRARLSDIGAVLHGADRIFYYPAAMQPWLSTGAEDATRQLCACDEAAFAAFQSEASEQDKENAFVELDHWAVFGVFEQERLVSVVSMYPWDHTAIADLGVLTLPGFRGKGYAKALVRSISRHALSLGHQPQYRCQLDNSASNALAQASGLSLFGTWEVVSSGSWLQRERNGEAALAAPISKRL